MGRFDDAPVAQSQTLVIDRMPVRTDALCRFDLPHHRLTLFSMFTHRHSVPLFAGS